jgi:hypothetical protein
MCYQIIQKQPHLALSFPVPHYRKLNQAVVRHKQGISVTAACTPKTDPPPPFRVDDITISPLPATMTGSLNLPRLPQKIYTFSEALLLGAKCRAPDSHLAGREFNSCPVGSSCYVLRLSSVHSRNAECLTYLTTVSFHV